jgi:hypothetical protein
VQRKLIRRTSLVLAAAVVLVLSGCGQDRPDVTTPAPGPTGTPTSVPAVAPSSPADPQDAPQQQAVDAYVGMQRAYQEAVGTADPDHPDLARYAAGEALQRLRDGIVSIRDRGLRGRGEATFQPVVESLDPPDAPTRITVRDCMDTSGTELYDPSGQPYEDEPGGLRLVIATVEILDGAWKVTSVGIHEVGTCQRAN